MALYDYVLFVIGGGSGGVRAARMASGYGAKVGIAEEYRWGGTCVIRGCVPKKLLVYASHVHDEIKDAAGFGWTIPEAQFSWPKLIENKDKEIARLSAIYVDLLKKSKVQVIEARARVVDPHTVEVDGRRESADVAYGVELPLVVEAHRGWRVERQRHIGRREDVEAGGAGGIGLLLDGVDLAGVAGVRTRRHDRVGAQPLEEQLYAVSRSGLEAETSASATRKRA